jgi:chitinase
MQFEKGLNAALYGREDEKGEQRWYNVDYAIKYWISNGAPKEKLVLGLATYARCFTLAGNETNLGATTVGAGQAGTV